ncbi:hypothetical protein ALP85_200036 [Pseudomonas syringae pv. syringae]|nr:hypothetical protein ALP85_200036 [Pseudomonas syringae pv. syringae]
MLAVYGSSLKASQSDELERLKQRYEDWDLRILERFDRLAKKYGVLHLLKRGLAIDDVHLNLMYPAPLASSSERNKRQFAANLFSSTRQVRYSLSNTLEEIDLVLFINGLPFATLELKKPLDRPDRPLSRAEAVQAGSRH